MTPVRAWHGDPDLKTRTVERMRQHAEADRFIQGTYVRIDPAGGGRVQWRGCLHGCLIIEDVAAELNVDVARLLTYDVVDRGPRYWYVETERRFGIPSRVGSLLDGVYEESTRPTGDVAVEVLEALRVGANLDSVPDRLLLDLLTDPDWGHRSDHPLVRNLDLVRTHEKLVNVLHIRLAGSESTRDEWDEIRYTLADRLDVLDATSDLGPTFLLRFMLDVADSAYDRTGGFDATRRAGFLHGNYTEFIDQHYYPRVLRRLAEAPVHPAAATPTDDAPSRT